MSADRAAWITWHGTPAEGAALADVVARHCACRVSADGLRREICPPHRLLVEDQRALDGLLFARRTRGRWVRQEWGA